MASRITSFLRLLRDAVKGTDQDLTTISINKAILLLAVPMILEMGFEALFAVVDMMYVTRIGPEAMSTVGFTESILTIVYSLGFGISMGATALVARRIGEKKPEAASRAGAQAILLVVGISVIVALVGIFYTEDLLRMLGADELVISTGSGYTRWMLVGNIVILLLFMNNGTFRGAGDASRAMQALTLANVLNMALDPILIFGLGPIPAFGVEGAAIATNIGRGIGVLFQLYFLLRGSGQIRLLAAHFRPHLDILKRLMVISAGSVGQFVIASASWIFLMAIMAKFENDAVAAYTLAIRVILFTLLPAWGLSNAAATLVGQNLGAERPYRAERSAWRAAYINMVFLGLVSIFYFVAAPFVIGLFEPVEKVGVMAVECLRYLSVGYIFYALGMVLAQAFNGAGDTKTPTLLNIVFFWLLQIPLAYGLAVWLELGPIGVYIAVGVSESLLAVGSVVMFRRGKWKTVQV